ncbi:MAG: small multi-drug export protein, partial [Gemmatimonadota bacterium]
MTEKQPAKRVQAGSGPLRLKPTLRPQLKRIHRFGWALFLIWSVTLVVWAIIQPEPYASGWRLVLELLFLGRAISIADGIATGFGSAYLVFQNGLEDIILLLVLYPWVVAAYEGVSGHRWLKGTIDRVRRTAERNRKVVEPWGVIGLWTFVFFPFWSTGALVGGVVGYLLGMRTWVVFTSVFAGHVLSVVSLVWFFDQTRGVLASFGQGWVRFLPWIVLAALLLGTLAWRGIRRL